MIRYVAKASAPFFTAIVSGGLIAVVLVFFAVQAMPVFGWILWAFTIVAVLTGAWLWYRNEVATVLCAEDDPRGCRAAEGRARLTHLSHPERSG